MKPFWQEHDHYLVTEPTSLGHSLATEYPTRFVDHFAFGQARIASRATLAASGLRNFWASLRHTLRDRQDVVTSTGAGPAHFTALLGRLTGARFVRIASFWRVGGPLLVGRMGTPFSTTVIDQ